MLWVRAAPREPWGNTRFGDSCPESRSVPQSPPSSPQDENIMRSMQLFDNVI